MEGNFSYVQNETDTPSDINLTPYSVPTVAECQNEYWTVGASAGLVIDNKTDLHVDYSYYRADNYEVSSIAGLHYGMNVREHAVGATLGRQISANVRLKLQYGYFHYRDGTSGGHNNYDAHAVFSSLQFRF